ncbi:uncharacterized protein [Euwallacea similis]|uniref:uncharacterized protein n=1 Tax=Euwallacea similis TaxID=1736056 RepID=UPI00345022F7
MGCNTSKETSSNNQNENESREEGDRHKSGGENHVGTDLSAKDTRTSSSKTITIRSNGTVEGQNSDTPKGEDEAATKIQAAFRGHKTRKSMKQPQAKQEPEREPTREELENEFRLDDPELRNAATKIQASFRGHMTRKNIEKGHDESGSKDDKKEEEVDIDLTDPDLNKAAAKIQASFRGHLTRKEGHGEAETSTSN